MQAARLPAQRGAHWLSAASRLVMRAPLLLSAASLSFWLLLFAAMLIPPGGVFSVILAPFLSAGLVNLIRRVHAGEEVGVLELFSAFGPRWRTLAALGGITLVAALLLGLLAQWLAGTPRLAELGSEDPRVVAAALQSPELRNFVLVQALLFVPLWVLNWFAPVLAARWPISAAKALVFSAIACVRNLAPLLVFLSIAALVMLVLGSVVGPFLLGIAGNFGGVLGAALGVLTMTILQAAYCLSVQDIFRDAA